MCLIPFALKGHRHYPLSGMTYRVDFKISNIKGL